MAKRIEITAPDTLLDSIDAYCKTKKKHRSEQIKEWITCGLNNSTGTAKVDTGTENLPVPVQQEITVPVLTPKQNVLVQEIKALLHVDDISTGTLLDEILLQTRDELLTVPVQVNDTGTIPVRKMHTDLERLTPPTCCPDCGRSLEQVEDEEKGSILCCQEDGYWIKTSKIIA